MTFRLLVGVVLLFLTLQVSGRIFDTDLDSVVTEGNFCICLPSCRFDKRIDG